MSLRLWGRAYISHLTALWPQRLQATKPVVIVGDLNVCHTPLDVSHPDFFAAATKPVTVGTADKGLPGQPGYTQLVGLDAC